MKNVKRHLIIKGLIWRINALNKKENFKIGDLIISKTLEEEYGIMGIAKIIETDKLMNYHQEIVQYKNNHNLIVDINHIPLATKEETIKHKLQKIFIK